MQTVNKLVFGREKSYSAPMTDLTDTREPATGADDGLPIEELMHQVKKVVEQLRAAGGRPHNVVFALTTVAADVALDTAPDSLHVIAVLLDAIAYQAKRRIHMSSVTSDVGADAEGSLELGPTIH